MHHDLSIHPADQPREGRFILVVGCSVDGKSNSLNSGVRLPSRVRSRHLAVPPISPARQESAKIHTNLFHGRPPDIPPPVIDLVDTQVAVEEESVWYCYRAANCVGRVDDI